MVGLPSSGQDKDKDKDGDEDEDAMITPGPAPKLQVVGIDGSPGAGRALRWASARVDLLGPIQPVMAWHHPWWALLPTGVGRAGVVVETDFGDAAATTARRQLDRVDAGICRAPIVIHGSTGPALTAVAGRGSLLVVGSRGRGRVAAPLLGSTGRYAVRHCSQPVVVVPEQSPFDDNDARILVGIDGSPESMRALDWAIDNTPTACPIELMHAWSGDGATAGVSSLNDRRRAELSAALVDEAVDRARARASDQRLIDGQSRDGDRRHVLRQEATHCGLLVVGNRGHGGVSSLLLGSTATALVEQPVTPTVVVR